MSVYQLRNEFGGYCDLQKMDFGTVDTSVAVGITKVKNPWQDGGCVPLKPRGVAATAVGNSELTLTWKAPASDGGAGIDGYRVEWKSGSQQYDTSRQAEVPRSTMTHRITGLSTSTEYTVQVFAYNYFGDGAALAVTATTGGPSNTKPSFPAAETGARSVAENMAPSENIGSPVAASDTDSDELSYSLGGPDARFFDTVSRTGQLKTRAVFDRETKASYSLTVSVLDGQDAFGNADAEIDDTIAVTVTVSDVDEPPMIAGPLWVNYPAGGSGEAAVYSADDPEGISVTWSLVGTDSDDFAIDARGALRFREPPVLRLPSDADSDNVYYVTVRASDGTHTATRDVAVAVYEVDEPLTIAGPTSINYPEHSTRTVSPFTAIGPEGETVSWGRRGIDSFDFLLDDDGAISFDTPPDYEHPADSNGDNIYHFMILAHAGDARAALDVTVTVINIDEAGTVALSSSQPLAGTMLIATLEDPDGNLTDVSWSWERSSNTQTWSKVPGAVSAQYTPDIADAGHRLRATASYRDAHGADKHAHAVTTAAVSSSTAGFVDVDPAGAHAPSIEALFAADITVGCHTDPLRYCPTKPVTRAQMATFLTRALNLTAPNKPAGFTDNDSAGAHAPSIEALFAADITVGCHTDPLRYCPTKPVTRAQMATFLTRALNLTAPNKPAGFTDNDSAGVHAPSIEALFAADITVGCHTDPLRYCSTKPVTRAQMATFLTRALNLPQP